MRFVELKSEAQLDAQILHRARSRLVGQRTALINQLRALLLERGIVVAKGRRQLEQRLAQMLDEAAEAPTSLSPRTRLLIEDMRLEWRELDRRIAALSAEFVARARDHYLIDQHSLLPDDRCRGIHCRLHRCHISRKRDERLAAKRHRQPDLDQLDVGRLYRGVRPLD